MISNTQGLKPNIFEQTSSTRLNRLRKNSINSPEASGHDFSRADKAHRINRPLAPEGRSSRTLELVAPVSILRPGNHEPQPAGIFWSLISDP